jgi:subtilase family serine protease
MNDELKYLVDLINMVRDEEDDANKRRLWSLIAILAKKQIGELSQLDAVSILSEIHELNFEQFIKIQAKNFYSDFTFNQLYRLCSNGTQQKTR